MRMRTVATLGMVVGFALALMQFTGTAQAQFGAAPLSATTIPTAQLMQPEDLVKLINAKGAGKPLMLQVGSRLMFDQAHIPGSEYAGPGASEDGLAALRNRVKALPKSSFIVLYCGCCPWNRCPNVGNAYKALHDLGFTKVKVVYFADNFGTDWANKGYPVAH